jgi:uncharacterized protein (TIGR02466 family)
MKNTIHKYFLEKNYIKIIETIDENNTDIELIEIKGISALQLKKFNLAENIFKKLCILNNSFSNNYHLALSLMNQDKFEQAIQFFKKSENDKNLLVASMINQAHCLYKTKRNQQAIKVLKKVLGINNSIKQAHYMLLEIYRKDNNYDAIKNQLIESKEYIGMDYEWFKNKCYNLYFNKEYKQLIQIISAAGHKNKIEILSLLANSYNKIKDYTSSVDVFNTIVVLEPQKEIHWHNLSSAYSHLTSNADLSQSLNCAQKCLMINSRYHKAYYCRSIVYEKLTDYESAITDIKKAIEIESTIKYQYKLAELLSYTRDKEKSLKILNTILQQDTRNKLAHRLKGIIQLQLGNPIKSEKSLIKTLKIDNTDQRSLAYYVIAKQAQNKVPQVNELLSQEKLVRKYKFDPTPEYKNLKDFNNNFEKDIKNHSLLRKEPNGLAARNGYLTDNIFKDKTQSILLYRKLLEEKIRDYIINLPDDKTHHMLRHKTLDYHINAWATWIKGDGFIDKHIHEESWISGAYYCKVPKIIENTETHQGYFEYGCIPDDINNKIINKTKGYIKPEEGTLVIFPSYLYHQTIPHDSNEDRISIAFDLTPKSWL